jgi:hypothetical protein
MARCFDPRHWIRATQGDKTVDIVFCFGCGQIYFDHDAMKDEETTDSILSGMQPAFDEILKAAGVPLAVTMKE